MFVYAEDMLGISTPPRTAKDDFRGNGFAA